MSRPDRSRWPTGSVALGVVAAGAVAASWEMVRRGADTGRGLAWMDDVLGPRWRRPRGTAVDRMVAATTDIGSVYGFVGTSGVLAVTGRRRAAADVLGAGVVAWVLAQGAKPLLDRDRPYEGGLGELLVHPPMGSSWPSGHTAVAAAVATVVADSGRVGACSGVASALWVGWSRIYVGAHHPSDIVAGMGLGVVSTVTWRRLATVVRDRLDD